MARYAQELSASITEHMLAYFNNYCDVSGDTCVSVAGLTNWRASLSERDEYKLGALKSFLISWHEWGFPGVDGDVVAYLDELNLKGNIKGAAVAGMCPYSGPLTLMEQQSLLDWASNAFSERLLTLTQYAFFLTLMFTGRRAVQIRYLRAGDLKAREDEQGREYAVKFPRAKQRGSGFRKQFNSMSVVEELYLLLHNQAEASRRAIEGYIGRKVPERLIPQIPIFIETTRAQSVVSIDQLESILRDRADYLHMTEDAGRDLVRHVSVRNQAISERTGEFINFTSRRFRYTKGTNLARRGITGVALAAALDHTDTQNIDVYVENTVETAKQIDEVMAPLLAPLAQAFAGKLIRSEREALRANDPHSRVKNGSSNDVGNCGTHAFCVSGYRACYTCNRFEPWVDAPHEEVRDELLEERRRQQAAGVSKFVMQSTDRTLLAVEQVIQLCRKAKAIDAEATEVGRG